MNGLELQFPQGESGFDPGAEIGVRASWEMPEAPEYLEVRLVWNTSGKGDQDIKIVKLVRINSESRAGHEDVAFTLPWGPYSFSGKLISVIWAIELVAFPDHDSVRQEFVMAPGGREVVIGRG